jgi:hypothetical protein
VSPECLVPGGALGRHQAGDDRVVGGSVAPPRWVPHVPKGTRGRPASRADLAEDGPRPVAIRTLAETLTRTTACWREETKGTLAAEFAWVRV